jgi:hypothetical protein
MEARVQRLRWLRPASTILAGVVGAVGLGKVAPVATSLHRAFGLSPLLEGTEISAVVLVAVIAAAPTGLRIHVEHSGRWLAAGLGLIAVAGAATSGGAQSVFVLVALRVVEGAGYLLVVLAGPIALLGQVSVERRSFVLAIWGSCGPLVSPSPRRSEACSTP